MNEPTIQTCIAEGGRCLVRIAPAERYGKYHSRVWFEGRGRSWLEAFEECCAAIHRATVRSNRHGPRSHRYRGAWALCIQGVIRRPAA